MSISKPWRDSSTHEGQVISFVLFQLAQKPEVLQQAVELIWPPGFVSSDVEAFRLAQFEPLAEVLNKIAEPHNVGWSWSADRNHRLVARGLKHVAVACADTYPIRQSSHCDPANVQAVCRFIRTGATAMFE